MKTYKEFCLQFEKFNYEKYKNNLPAGVRKDMNIGGKTTSPVSDAAIAAGALAVAKPAAMAVPIMRTASAISGISDVRKSIKNKEPILKTIQRGAAGALNTTFPYKKGFPGFLKSKRFIGGTLIQPTD
tara:strand:+ start:562 stop:945 length:384 start_codon:yes stop_codon:yes gene_type:complete